MERSPIRFDILCDVTGIETIATGIGKRGIKIKRFL
jgi:hypothetical protein